MHGWWYETPTETHIDALREEMGSYRRKDQALFERFSTVALAMMIEDGFVVEWPWAFTRRGAAWYRSHYRVKSNGMPVYPDRYHRLGTLYAEAP